MEQFSREVKIRSNSLSKLHGAQFLLTYLSEGRAHGGVPGSFIGEKQR